MFQIIPKVAGQVSINRGFVHLVTAISSRSRSQSNDPHPTIAGKFYAFREPNQIDTFMHFLERCRRLIRLNIQSCFKNLQEDARTSRPAMETGSDSCAIPIFAEDRRALVTPIQKVFAPMHFLRPDGQSVPRHPSRLRDQKDHTYWASVHLVDDI